MIKPFCYIEPNKWLQSGNGYSGQVEINYFNGKNKFWVLKEKDLYLRGRRDLKKVDNFTTDKRSNYFLK